MRVTIDMHQSHALVDLRRGYSLCKQHSVMLVAVGRSTYDGQHKTGVLETDRSSVAAVVKAAGHTTGCMLRLVYPFGFWWFCSHYAVASGGRHLSVPPAKYPYPGSQAACEYIVSMYQ